MVTIRCTAGISTEQQPNVINAPTPDVVSFPQGELEFSIYRPADGKGVDLLLAGYDEDDLAQANNILDTLEAPEFAELSDTVLFFSEQPTQPSVASQAAHKTPEYYREVRTQYQQTLCPPYSTNYDIINLGDLRVFMINFLVLPEGLSLDNPALALLRQELLFDSRLPHLIFIDNGFTLQSNVSIDVFNQEFDNVIIPDARRLRATKCNQFSVSGVIPEGDTFALATDIDVNSSGNINRRPPAIRSDTNLFSFHTILDSNLQFYEYKQEVAANHNNTFRTQAADIEQIDTENTKFFTDFRASDLETVPYNIA